MASEYRLRLSLLIAVSDEKERLYTPKQVVDNGLKNRKCVYIACGWNHTMAIDDKGCLWTWGGNASGAIGDGTNEMMTKPYMVKGALAGQQVIWAAGAQNHVIACTSKGQMFSWGDSGHHLGRHSSNNS